MRRFCVRFWLKDSGLLVYVDIVLEYEFGFEFSVGFEVVDVDCGLGCVVVTGFLMRVLLYAMNWISICRFWN